jgi:C-terminal processing protease CtpA/Prc
MQKHSIGVNSGSQVYGLSLLYRGAGLFEENDIGVVVSKLVPGGNAQRAGLKENDKVLKINKKVPKDVNESVDLIRKAGGHISLQIERWDEDKFEHLKRIGSARSFNTGYAVSRPHSPNIMMNWKY